MIAVGSSGSGSHSIEALQEASPGNVPEVKKVKEALAMGLSWEISWVLNGDILNGNFQYGDIVNGM